MSGFSRGRNGYRFDSGTKKTPEGVFIDKVPKFGNSYQAYEELMENLLPAIGKKCYEIPYDEFRCPILSEKDYDNVSRAVYYLKSVNSDK